MDSGKYSRELLSNANEVLREHALYSATTPKPVEVMKQAYLKTQSLGSTTVCFAFLNERSRMVECANLGDSGYLLYNSQKKEILARSDELVHSFNFPFQLGPGSADMPEHSAVTSFPVDHNDVLILGTDGLWDNLHDEEIVETIESNQEKPSQVIAQALVIRAFRASLNTQRRSPFWERSGLKDKLGGKPDDITVLVAKVKDPWRTPREQVSEEVAKALQIDEMIQELRQDSKKREESRKQARSARKQDTNQFIKAANAKFNQTDRK